MTGATGPRDAFRVRRGGRTSGCRGADGGVARARDSAYPGGEVPPRTPLGDPLAPRCADRRELTDLRKLVIALTATLALAGAAFGQTLTVWTTFQDQTLDWLREQAAAFSEGFGVDVQLVRLDVGELKQQALLSARQGEAGDGFVGVPHDQIGEMAIGGVLLDMTGYATAAYPAHLAGRAREGYTVNGRGYGLPMLVEGRALDVSSDVVTGDQETYEAMHVLAQELTPPDALG